MILIGDSGGSKTDWRLIDGAKISQFKSPGMNPYIVSQEEIDESVSELSSGLEKKSVLEVYFYGAGCSNAENVRKIADVLNQYFPDAFIEVNHDLLAAARALCGREKGIACILGTGANSCLYDGNDIVENIPSLGYILGDEGSGAHLGKSLISHFFSETLPLELAEKLTKRYDMSRETVLENVYQRSQPAHYLAGFSKFLFDNRSHPFVTNLICHAFKLFFERNVLKYRQAPEVPIHFSGSVAFYYNTILRQAAGEFDLVIKNIIESPIAGLTLFHQEK